MEIPSPVPRYVELAEAMKLQMKGLAPNVLLPSEDQLAKQFNVSRVTIRRALDLLEQGGLVDRQRGRGTIVSIPKVTRTLFPTVPIEKDLGDQGLLLETELLSLERGSLTERGAEQLQITSDRRIATISLLRRVDRRVICLDQRHVAEQLLERINFDEIGKVPLAVLIARCSDRPVVRYDWKLEFQPSSAKIAKILGVTPGTLIVVSSGIDYLEDDTPLSMSEVSYRIDRVQFSCSAPYRLDSLGGHPKENSRE